MRIFLENKSNKTLFINLNGQQMSLHPFGSDFAVFEGDRVSMNLTTQDNYSSEKYGEKAGYYWCHRFVTESQYDFTLQDEIAVELYVETKKGDHLEAYQRVVLYSKDFAFPEPIYTLKNESEIREKFSQNEKLTNKAERRADFIVKADNVRTVISNIILAVLTVAITAIIFVGIWQNFSLKAAIITYAVIASVCFIGYKILKKFFNGIGKTADKIFSSKLFDKAMDKASEKFDEKFVYCKGMPEDLYKNQDSFFDNAYISAVFKFSDKII
ncbi:MAG: hypothetical protein UHM85_00045 [Acutalibacteraceae bacterium]|nr:hypothetical protein [Acutalibacteraceae bacterium]